MIGFYFKGEQSMKILLKLIGLSLIISSVSADYPKLDKEKLAEIKKNTIILQNPNLSLVDGIDQGDVYFVKVKVPTPKGMEKFKVYVDKKTGMAFVGEAFDKEGKLLVFPKEKKIVDEGVAFSYGHGKKELYLVSDPECPYCKKFEKESQGKLDEYTVHVIFFPLSFHKESPAMIEWIMQGKDDKAKKARMDEIMLKNSTAYRTLIKDNKKPFSYSVETRKAITRSMKAVDELEVQGTPSLYNDKLEYRDWVQLVMPQK